MADPNDTPNWSDREPALVEEDLRSKASKLMLRRREAIRCAGLYHGEEGSDSLPPPLDALGLALSGGGIRSATISLGVVQSLARKQRLLDFDYCSTVSGGGYCGSFLGGLFLPDFARGDTPETTPRAGCKTDDPAHKAAFALKALRCDPQSTEEQYPGSLSPDCSCEPTKVRNPVWWLREHSRYLAPNGPSDYLNAVTNLIRNWLAMIFVSVLPIAVVVLGLIAATWFLLHSDLVSEFAADWIFAEIPDATCPAKCPATPVADVPISIVALLVPAALFVALASGFAYWQTSYMTSGGRRWLIQRNRLLWSFRFSFPLILLAIGGLLLWFAQAFSEPHRVMDWIGLPHPPAGKRSEIDYAWLTYWLLFAATLSATALHIFAHLLAYPIWRRTRSADGFTAEVRRLLTRSMSRALLVMQILVAVAVVDTLARWLYENLAQEGSRLFGLSGLTLAPLAAFLIKKVPEWFGDADSRIGRVVGKHVWTLALIVAVLCYLALILSVHLVLQALIFEGESWSSRGAIDEGFVWTQQFAPQRMLVCTILVVLLGVVVDQTGNFINMSSLHNLYGSRLTRAYLGAGNLVRLHENALSSSSGRIIESHPGDQIDIAAYQLAFANAQNFAPMHLVNVTLNETMSPHGSQLQDRDRKGVPVVFAPEGVLIDVGRGATDRNAFSWPKMTGVEPLSVGQLMAISGAAASTGMGARTTLGGSLAFTFANIRLGYWWNLNGLLTRLDCRPPSPGITFAGPYGYLMREMVSRYTRTTPRVNISDGGHFENSGAYELLRRRVTTILVCDNGADPKFHFEDLEQLIRKARLDLGIDLKVAAREKVRQVLAGKDDVLDDVVIPGIELFLNGGTADWRCRAAAKDKECDVAVPKDAAFCLLLEAAACDGSWRGLLVWMKPRLFQGVEHDIVGYATAHPTFPQESTGDQFFDEAQWESYRRLGVTMIDTLLDSARTDGTNLFRDLDAYSRRKRGAQPASTS